MDEKAREIVVAKIYDVCDFLEARGIDQKAILRRDKREPGRRRKEEREDKIFVVVMRYFRDQRAEIKKILEVWYPNRKAELPPGSGNLEGVFNNEEFKAAMIRIMSDAIEDSILLFGETERIGIDYTLVNAEAAEWAKNYTFDLVKGIEETSRTALQKAISGFVDTPGMTIGDVVQKLPYSEQRAISIATTEITRAYARGNQMAGEELAKQFPGVRVIKKWFTNADDRVCPLCAPLDGEETEIDKSFNDGSENPPIHVNCRCWTTTTTDLAETAEIPQIEQIIKPAPAFENPESTETKTMLRLAEETKMTDRQSKALTTMNDAYSEGKKYSGKGYRNLRELYSDHPEVFEKIDNMTFKEMVAFDNGVRGGEGNFEFVTAWRVGNIPENGLSMNYAEQRLENGLSVMEASNGMATDDPLSKMFLVAKNRPVIYVSGFVNPNNFGGDGEPLLLAVNLLKQ